MKQSWMNMQHQERKRLLKEEVEWNRTADEQRWKTHNRSMLITNPILEFESKLSKIDFLKPKKEEDD